MEVEILDRADGPRASDVIEMRESWTWPRPSEMSLLLFFVFFESLRVEELVRRAVASTREASYSASWERAFSSAREAIFVFRSFWPQKIPSHVQAVVQ